MVGGVLSGGRDFIGELIQQSWEEKRTGSRLLRGGAGQKMDEAYAFREDTGERDKRRGQRR